jgi:catechol 2,3-dioxygenase-like lactoylglutathione lyase family enzyme
MSNQILGIHHVTAIASDPQRNVDFYAGLLGLRLVKVTVNFDMPDTYHFYYGDATGSPGTILTFFCWIGARKGRPGAGQIAVTSFSIPAGSTAYWTERLTSQNVAVEGPTGRLGDDVLSFSDPDGLRLELIAHAGAPSVAGWNHTTVSPEHAIRGFHGATLAAGRSEPTEALLTDGLGFTRVRSEGNRIRYAAGPSAPGRFVDVLRVPNDGTGNVAVGSVHHIAWRTPTDEDELAWRKSLAKLGLGVSPVRDRQYFNSIYFVEPSGVLFEIATDPPGFATDETVEELGQSLKLPPWLESQRKALELALPPIHRPATID